MYTVYKYRKSIIIIILIIILLISLFIQNHVECIENKHIDMELVVSRYNENLEWLKDEPFNKYPVICYNKGSNDNFYKPENMKIVNLENVGRCDHTYIYHIVHNYENLARHTMFLPGSCNIQYKLDKAKRWINEIEKTDSGVFIGSNRPNGIDEFFNDFQLDIWSASDESNKKLNPEEKLMPNDTRPFGNWYRKHFNNIKVYYSTGGGVMGIERENIIQHPKSYYNIFLSELDKHSNPEVGHYFERAWVAVFYPMVGVRFIDY